MLKRRNTISLALQGPCGPVDQSVYLNCYEHLLGFDTKTDIHLIDEFLKNLEFLTLMRTLFWEKIFSEEEKKTSIDGPHVAEPS
jgi:hypothetical protein